jgi:hypothetical protein
LKIRRERRILAIANALDGRAERRRLIPRQERAAVDLDHQVRRCEGRHSVSVTSRLSEAAMQPDAQKRVAFVTPEPVRQLLRHAISHLTVDRLHRAAIASVEKLLDRGNAHSLALCVRGKPYQLFHEYWRLLTERR